MVEDADSLVISIEDWDAGEIFWYYFDSWFGAGDGREGGWEWKV